MKQIFDVFFFNWSFIRTTYSCSKRVKKFLLDRFLFYWKSLPKVFLKVICDFVVSFRAVVMGSPVTMDINQASFLQLCPPISAYQGCPVFVGRYDLINRESFRSTVIIVEFYAKLCQDRFVGLCVHCMWSIRLQ